MKHTEQKIQTAIVVAPEVVAAFWARVDQSGGPDACWPWTGSIKPNGYGNVRLRGDTYRNTHRVAYEFHCGEPPGAMNVCHRCDNRRCCNPAHLWLGTQKQNMQDAIAKGRNSRPPVTDWVMVLREKRHHAQVITEAQAVEIRNRALAGENQGKIGADYGVGSRLVSKIKLGQRWGHV